MFAQFPTIKTYVRILDESIGNYDIFTSLVKYIFNFQGKYMISDYFYDLRRITLLEIDSIILIEHVHNRNN